MIPFLAMAPTESANTEPAGDVFTARDRIDDTFASTVRGIGFVIEDPDGDILRAALAPMPLFAAYGLLTALMIVMALTATLVVLPSVLVMITRDRPVTEHSGPLNRI